MPAQFAIPPHLQFTPAKEIPELYSRAMQMRMQLKIARERNAVQAQIAAVNAQVRQQQIQADALRRQQELQIQAAYQAQQASFRERELRNAEALQRLREETAAREAQSFQPEVKMLPRPGGGEPIPVIRTGLNTWQQPIQRPEEKVGTLTQRERAQVSDLKSQRTDIQNQIGNPLIAEALPPEQYSSLTNRLADINRQLNNILYPPEKKSEEDRVKVVNPQGVQGTILRKHLQEALKLQWRLAE